MRNELRFVPLALEHRPLIADWTRQPHVREWWTDAADHVDEFFQPDIQTPYIAFLGGEPVAYLQSWPPQREGEYTWQHGLPEDVRGMDLFIGPPGKLGHGLGTFLVRHFAAKLFAEGASRVVIDPDRRNERAIACYMKAGFTPYDEWTDVDGNQFLLMELAAEDCEWLGKT